MVFLAFKQNLAISMVVIGILAVATLAGWAGIVWPSSRMRAVRFVVIASSCDCWDTRLRSRVDDPQMSDYRVAVVPALVRTQGINRIDASSAPRRK